MNWPHELPIKRKKRKTIAPETRLDLNTHISVRRIDKIVIYWQRFRCIRYNVLTAEMAEWERERQNDENAFNSLRTKDGVNFSFVQIVSELEWMMMWMNLKHFVLCRSFSENFLLFIFASGCGFWSDTNNNKLNAVPICLLFRGSFTSCVGRKGPTMRDNLQLDSYLCRVRPFHCGILRVYSYTGLPK